jgi:hypothetical protein
MSVFGSVLGTILQSALKDPNFQNAAVNTVKQIGQEGVKKIQSGDTAGAEALFNSLAQNAPAVVGAIVANTAAATHVDPAIVQQAQTAVQK